MLVGFSFAPPGFLGPFAAVLGREIPRPVFARSVVF